VACASGWLPAYRAEPLTVNRWCDAIGFGSGLRSHLLLLAHSFARTHRRLWRIAAQFGAGDLIARRANSGVGGDNMPLLARHRASFYIVRVSRCGYLRLFTISGYALSTSSASFISCAYLHHEKKRKETRKKERKEEQTSLQPGRQARLWMSWPAICRVLWRRVFLAHVRFGVSHHCDVGLAFMRCGSVTGA